MCLGPSGRGRHRHHTPSAFDRECDDRDVIPHELGHLAGSVVRHDIDHRGTCRPSRRRSRHRRRIRAVGSDVAIERPDTGSHIRKDSIMKFVILIHSNPQPWGHPTGDFNAEFQALSAEEQARMGAEFDDLLAELSSNGELVTGEALADPASATLVPVGRRCADRHRRSVRRDEGAIRRLLHDRRRRPGAGGGDRSQVRRPGRDRRVAAGDVARWRRPMIEARRRARLARRGAARARGPAPTRRRLRRM